MLLRSYHGHRHQVQYLYHMIRIGHLLEDQANQHQHHNPKNPLPNSRQHYTLVLPKPTKTKAHYHCSSCQDSFCSQMERLSTGSPGALPLTTFEMFTPTLGVTGHLLNCCALALTPIAISKAKSNVNFFIHSFLTMLSKIKYAITKITFCHSPFVITFLCTNFLHWIRLSNLQLDYIDVTSIIKAKHIRIRNHTRIRQGN